MTPGLRPDAVTRSMRALSREGRRPADLGLKGRKAIVCAASKWAFGKACAMSLAREGVDVVITARTASDLEAAAAEIRAETSAKVIAVPCVTSPRTPAAPPLLAACPNPDILVNNAGGPPRAISANGAATT